MHFVKTLILAALPTIVDLGIDSFSAEKFIVGANYKRWVANLSDIQINNNCVRTSSNSDDGFLEITCFEQDTIWGRITAGLIFILARKENAVIRIWVYISHGWCHYFSWNPLSIKSDHSFCGSWLSSSFATSHQLVAFSSPFSPTNSARLPLLPASVVFERDRGGVKSSQADQMVLLHSK